MPVRFRIEDSALAGPLRQIEQLIRRAGGWSAAAYATSCLVGNREKEMGCYTDRNWQIRLLCGFA